MDKAPHGRRIWESAGQGLYILESPAFHRGIGFVGSCNVRNIIVTYWSRLRHERDTTTTWPRHSWGFFLAACAAPGRGYPCTTASLSLLGRLFHVIPIKSFPKSPVHQRNLMASVVSTWTSPSGCRSETIADQTPDHRPQLLLMFMCLCLSSMVFQPRSVTDVFSLQIWVASGSLFMRFWSCGSDMILSFSWSKDVKLFHCTMAVPTRGPSLHLEPLHWPAPAEGSKFGLMPFIKSG